MLNCKVLLSKDADKFLNKLDSSINKRVRKELGKLKEHQELGKILVGKLTGLRSIRIGKFRVLYKIISSDVVFVTRIGYRKNIYEGS